MKLTPREIDKAELFSIGHIGNMLYHMKSVRLLTPSTSTAQRRLAQGLRLSAPEATALLATQIMHLARSGQHTVALLMDLGRTLIGHRQVIPGVAALLEEVQVEATFPDGTKLVSLHHPICLENGDLTLALDGSFLPVPPLSQFPDHPEEGLVPGEIIPDHSVQIRLNAGREVVEVVVVNTADRPIQVGSHYHFIEANPLLRFDRRASYGMRLNIAAGTSVRFEPGQPKTVSLVSIGGKQIIRGGNNLCNGVVNKMDDSVLQTVMHRLEVQGFLHEPIEADGADGSNPTKRRKLSPYEEGLPISRDLYARMYGPTTGDVVRLADTQLYIRVESDRTVYGDELKFGGGKVLRDGMGQAAGLHTAQQLDTVITNALILDHTGIFKADVGIKAGRIVGIGRAGNPDTMDSVDEHMWCGSNTDVIAGEGMLLTAGGMDSHVHFICPQMCEEALASGLTTLLGGGTGPSSGSCATTCTPGPAHMKSMLLATDEMPLNIAFTGKGSTSSPEGLLEVVEAGAVGLKLHEDWGTTPATIDCCLTLADQEDVQVTIHTDTLNESSCVEGTLAAIKGRTIHTYHTEGAGGGHAPDIITVAGHPNVIPSSTNPTRPLTVNTMDEHLDMLMVCHHLDKSLPEDVAFAESRIRRETVAAEDVLHDTGAISIISSDAQAMGRVGEVITRTWQSACKMKRQRGQLPQDAAADQDYLSQHPACSNSHIRTDNFRVRRYLAKYTINPCIAHGMAAEIGSVEVGKLADLVLWKPAYFGVKPELVVKGGHICWAQMGDPGASIPTPQPVKGRPMFAAIGRAASACSLAFVSRRCLESGVGASYALHKSLVAVRGTRSIGKRDMVLNDSVPVITVDPQTYQVTADGQLLTSAPDSALPLAQRYFLF